VQIPSIFLKANFMTTPFRKLVLIAPQSTSVVERAAGRKQQQHYY